MNEQMIKSSNAQICAQSFGNPKDPCVLLIMGAMSSMIWWDEDFCIRLAANGKFVIRYDNRDTGKSTSKDKLDYNIVDMAGDAVAVLDAYNIKKADIAGMSLGGMIAQILALKYPSRVNTITAIASGIFDDRPELGGIDKKITDYHASFANVDLTNKDMLIKYLAEGAALLCGPERKCDIEQAYKLSKAEVERAVNIFSMFNHATLGGGEEYYGKTGMIDKPVLVIHGSDDPVLPFPHAKALADESKNAKLVVLKGAGHEINKADWDLIINEIMSHTSLNGGTKK